MTHTTPQSETSTDGGQAATVPAKPATLMITAIAAVLALAGAAILTLGFASEQADTPIASSEVFAAEQSLPREVPASESAASPGPESFNDADLALIEALAEEFRRNPEDTLSTDPDCLARATLTALGGAAAIESRYGITVETVEDVIADLALPQSEAIALADGYFDCGLGDALAVVLGDDARVGECIANAVSMDVLRDFFASALMADDAEFAASAEEEFLFEMIAVLDDCPAAALDSTPTNPTNNDDLDGLITAFEGLVVPLGFEFAGNDITGFAELCLHPDRALRFFEYQRGTTRVSMIAGAPNGLEASDFYDYLTEGPYDCDFDEVLLNFLHVGVDGEFDVVDPYMWAVFRHPDEQVPRYEEYVRRGGFVYVASGLDPDEVEELRVLLRGTGPVG